MSELAAWTSSFLCKTEREREREEEEKEEEKKRVSRSEENKIAMAETRRQ